MKKIINIVLSISFIVALNSCSTDLDEVVFSSVTQQQYNYTVKDFDAAVSTSYAVLRNYVYQSGYWASQEITTDEIVMPANASGWDDAGRYKIMHFHKWNSEQLHVSKIWEVFYSGILLCNNAIDQIENNIIPSKSEQDKVKGLAELRALRAYYYWMVCDNFGDAPLVVTPSNDLPEKSSRTEIFDFIVTELNEVIPLLDETQGGKMYGRINKWAGKAILANIYLNAKVYVGKEYWDKCIKECDDIINSKKCDLSENYKDPFRSKGVENSKEVIFTIPFDQIYGGGNKLHLFSWHGALKKKLNLMSTPYGAGSAMGIPQFINTYDENDTRLADSWLMGPQYTLDGKPIMCTYDLLGEQINFTKDIPDGNYTKECEGYRMNKYEVEIGSTGNSNTDFPLIRYSQILMMKAECLLRLGKSGAGNLVTQVRQRAFKNMPGLAQVSDDQLKENSSYQYGYVENYKIVKPGNTDVIPFGRMLDELGWEFAWETNRRRDLIRFGVFTKKSWLSHEPQGDYRTVFPIPEYVIAANPKLKQNPNYLEDNINQ